MKEKNRCLFCNEPLLGRIDKKFCSDQCRNSYNNTLNRDLSNYIRNVNNILRKNHRILTKFNPEGKSKIKKTTLEAKGFNFNYFTNVYITKTGKTYYFCYDQGYLIIENNYLALVQKKEYVD